MLQTMCMKKKPRKKGKSEKRKWKMEKLKKLCLKNDAKKKTMLHTR